MHKKSAVNNAASSVEEAFDGLELGGQHSELRVFEQKELLELYERFQRNRAEFEEDLQVALLEQFLTNGIIGQEAALKIAAEFSSEQRASLGYFVGHTIADGRLAELFHQCWHDLSAEDRSHFARKYVEETPESAIMVAPFVDLTRYSALDETVRSDKPQRMPFLQKYFDSQEKLERLYKAYFDNDTLRGVDILANATQQFMGKVNWRIKTQNNVVDRSGYLIPLLPKLVEAGALSEEEARVYLKAKSEASFLFINADFYKTAEDKERLDKIYNQGVAFLRRQGEKDEHIDLYSLPEYFRDRYLNEECAARQRASSHLLDSYQEWSVLLDHTSQEKLLGLLMGSSLPVWSNLESLGLEDSQIKRIIMRQVREGELCCVMPDASDMVALVNAGYEKELLQYLKLTGGNDPQYEHQIIWAIDNWESVSGALSDAGRAELLDYLIERGPQILARRPGVLSEEQGRHSIPALIERIFKNPDLYRDECASLYVGLRGLERNGIELETSADQFREMVRELNRGMAHRFALSPNGSLFFSPEEVLSAIETRLARGDSALFEELVSKDYDGKYRAVLSNAIEARSEFGRQLLDSDMVFSPWRKLLAFVPEEQALKYLLGSGGEPDFGKVFYEVGESHSSSPFISLAFNPKEFARFSREISNPRNLAYLPEIVRLAGELAERTEMEGRTDFELQAAIGRVKKAAAKAVAIVVERAAETPTILFNKSILKHGGDSIKPAIEQNLGAFLRDFPEGVADIAGSIRNGLLLEHQHEYLPALITAVSKYGGLDFRKGEIPPEVLDTVAQLNPILAVSLGSDQAGDYYDHCIQKFSEFRYYSEFAERLQKIADREQQIYGKGQKLSEVEPNRDFIEAAKLLVALEQSPLAQEYAEFIRSLPQDQKDETINLLSIAYHYRLDQEPILDPADLLPELRQRIARRLSKVFEVDVDTQALDDLSARSINALSIYYRGACLENPQLRESFQTFIEEFSAGGYQSWKDWGGEVSSGQEKQEALEALIAEGQLPSKIRLEQYESWIRARGSTFSDELKVGAEEVRAGINTIFSQAIADNHIQEDLLTLGQPDAIQQEARLLGPIIADMQALKEIVARHPDKKEAAKDPEYKQLKNQIAEYRAEKAEEIDRAQAVVMLAALREISPDAMMRQELKVGRKVIRLNDVFKHLHKTFAAEHPDFSHDLGRVQELTRSLIADESGKQKAFRQDFIITDQPDLSSAILIGEEPVSSCQSYNGGSFNEGLLSYVIDPNVRVIRMLDSNGRIVARSIMRLLETEEGQPAIYMERVYSSNPHPKIEEAMKNFALAKAVEMRVLAYLSEVNFEVEPEALISRGSRNSAVYTDAGGGLRKGGRYSVEPVYLQ